MKAWFFTLLGIGVIVGIASMLTMLLDREQLAMLLGFCYGFLAAIPLHLLIAAARKSKNATTDWRQPLDDFDDSYYVKPQNPITVMRREPGVTWQIVEDNR